MGFLSGWNNKVASGQSGKVSRFFHNMLDKNNDGKVGGWEVVRTGAGMLNPMGIANNLVRGGYNMYQDSRSQPQSQYQSSIAPTSNGMTSQFYGNNFDSNQAMNMAQFGLGQYLGQSQNNISPSGGGDYWNFGQPQQNTSTLGGQVIDWNALPNSPTIGSTSVTAPRQSMYFAQQVARSPLISGADAHAAFIAKMNAENGLPFGTSNRVRPVENVIPGFKVATNAV